MFYLEYPGVGVSLRFTGLRDDEDPLWVKRLESLEVPFSCEVDKNQAKDVGFFIVPQHH